MSFASVYRGRLSFRFARSALFLAVVACVVLSFGARPGLCCFLRITLGKVRPPVQLLPRSYKSEGQKPHWRKPSVKGRATSLTMLDCQCCTSSTGHTFMNAIRAFRFRPWYKLLRGWRRCTSAAGCTTTSSPETSCTFPVPTPGHSLNLAAVHGSVRPASCPCPCFVLQTDCSRQTALQGPASI